MTDLSVAYADPPYLGMCNRYGHEHGPEGRCWDELDTHAALIARLADEFPDGWAMSLHAPSLRHILPLCPDDVRVSAWVKPFHSFKPGVNPSYGWEPVLWRGGRSAKERGRSCPTVMDFCVEPAVAANITLRRGFTGAKPEAFCLWLFDLLGLTPADSLTDLFVGSGAVSLTWERWRAGWYDGALVAEQGTLA